MLAMTADALYAWRSRLSKLVKRLAAELDETPVSDPEAARRIPEGEAT